MQLDNRKLVLGVTGSIAAYKACELLRLFVKGGADVYVTETEAACRLVAPATFEALSGHKVSTEIFNEASDIGHIELSAHADLIVVGVGLDAQDTPGRHDVRRSTKSGYIHVLYFSFPRPAAGVQFCADGLDLSRPKPVKQHGQNSQQEAQRNYITALQNYWLSYFKIRKLTLHDFENGVSLSDAFDYGVYLK